MSSKSHMKLKLFLNLGSLTDTVTEIVELASADLTAANYVYLLNVR